MAQSLKRDQQILSQLLLFKGCLSESEISRYFANENEEDEVDINAMVTVINRWNETNMTSLIIESYDYDIDNQRYYGWRPMVTDEVSKAAMLTLKAKQISFWKIFLNITLTNSGVISLNAAYTVIFYIYLYMYIFIGSRM